MFELFLPFFLLFLFFLVLSIIWRINARKYISSGTVASAYDAWTQDKLLERLWGEHIHLGFYAPEERHIDFRQAKVQFVHELVKWSGLDKLPKGSRILDVGCGIGGIDPTTPLNFAKPVAQAIILNRSIPIMIFPLIFIFSNTIIKTKAKHPRRTRGFLISPRVTSVTG